MNKIRFCKTIPVKYVLYVLVWLSAPGCNRLKPRPTLDHAALATRYFGNDAGWYISNIPFFECSDKQLEAVYYYRWKLYKAHIRKTYNNGYVITEFINHVAWDRDPYCTINAASMHHIYEGRWLKDNRYMDGYIDYLFQQGGNDRRYSESVADAAYARYLVNGDKAFIEKQLDSMKAIYNRWDDHYDSSRQLYYIPAMPDATEYTIASIDASGGKAGFDSGDAYRPTLNSYMYGNAMAIARIAAMKADSTTSNEYLQKALQLKSGIQTALWNDPLQHFTDRYKQDNQYVHNWDFIRGRELAGMIPWYFNLPDDNTTFGNAWKHVTDTGHLQGPYGFRTNEPSYEYYFKQIIYYMGQRGSQWNGPSWPYQSSQALTAMANLLNNYTHHSVKASDYVKLLRLFAQQHYLPDGRLDLVENYDPDKGGPIVYYYWSNHYNHSSFNNLVITGLCGIRPSAGDTLHINPLVDSSIQYFLLDDLVYHGHKLSVMYDVDGKKYHVAKGLTVYVDGNRSQLMANGNGYDIYLGKPITAATIKHPVNLALNLPGKGYPLPSASVNNIPDTSLYQAIDGRCWYFTEIANRWTTTGSTTDKDWYALDFGSGRRISGANIYLLADSVHFKVPDSISIDYLVGTEWKAAVLTTPNMELPLKGNTKNSIHFEPIRTNKVRINFYHTASQVAMSELELF